MVAAESDENCLCFDLCSIFGMPKQVPMTEDHPQEPMSPYATTKWMVERMLADFDRAYDLRSVVFRFFNACRCQPRGVNR
jgi:UDP-glucose 4-epimerase